MSRCGSTCVLAHQLHAAVPSAIQSVPLPLKRLPLWATVFLVTPLDYNLHSGAEIIGWRAGTCHDRPSNEERASASSASPAEGAVA